MYFKPVVVDQHFKRIMVLAFFSFLLSLDDYVPLSHLKFVFLAVLGIKLEVARIKIGFEARLRPFSIHPLGKAIEVQFGELLSFCLGKLSVAAAVVVVVGREVVAIVVVDVTYTSSLLSLTYIEWPI